MTSIVWKDRVYIRNGDGCEELYDLDNDPSQAHDLARSADVRAVLEPFRSALAGLRPDLASPRRTR
jgi:hypothetical protein